MAKADLHVHSKHSNRPSEWILRQFGAPESFTEPLEVYRRCRERGMDFITLSDHDTIDGALEILHLPGTFASCEVTVSFPEDGCEIHCLVLGIDETQHRDLQELRGNVYELRDYLRENDILHSVAHPLFRVNDRLTLDHLEKLLVLFDRFEALNGIHDRRQNDLVRRIFGSLTPEMMARLTERHRLEPMSDTPWIKTFTGGSDDHGGVYIATTYTETPPAATVEEYLTHLRAGRHDSGGDTGSSLRLTQSFYSLAHEFYRRQFPFGVNPRKDPFSELLRSLGRGNSEPRERGLRGRLAAVVPFPGSRRPEKERVEEKLATPDRLTFEAAARASQDVLSTLVGGFLAQIRRGRLDESLAAAAAQLAPLALSLAPFLVALRAQHKDTDLLDLASRCFLGHEAEDGRDHRRAWFTDDLEQAHGVLRVLARQGMPARESIHSLVAVTCGAEPRPTGFEVVSFRPMMTLPIPGGEPQALTVPPLLEILEHCERQRYREILVSTPGPLGLAGLAAGKLLGIPVTGVYDTTLPGQVRRWTGSHSLEEMSWLYLRWLFGAMDALWVAGRHDRERLAGRGFDIARMREVGAVVGEALGFRREPDPAVPSWNPEEERIAAIGERA